MLSPTALAYVRARNADPMCSFGDFAAISHIVDVATAKVRMIYFVSLRLPLVMEWECSRCSQSFVNLIS